MTRSAATDEVLDAMIVALAERGFGPPGTDSIANRDALVAALVDVAIEHGLRIRIDKQPGRPIIRKQTIEPTSRGQRET